MPNPFEPTPQQRVIFDNLINGVYFVDRNRRITYWNRSAEAISGYKAEEVLGKSCKDDILIHALGCDILCDCHCPLVSTMELFEPVSAAVSLRHKHGYRVPVQVRCVPLLDENNVTVGAVEIFEHSYVQEDVAVRLKELGQIAYLDALTELPNRRYMEDAVEDWLVAYSRKGRGFAVAMGDIDFFKDINDQYGHDTGDLVLRTVGKSLCANLRALDIVGRWGGEEFLVLLHDVAPDQLREKLELLRKAIKQQTIIIEEDIPIGVTLSFGGTLPRREDTVLTLVARADAFLYKSKREGRDRVNTGV